MTGTEKKPSNQEEPSGQGARLWHIQNAADPRIKEAGRILREGGLVAFPTETVYGLGANGLDGPAAARIFAAKRRPADNPLILHVASLEQAKALASEWSPKAQLAAEKLWPGPLTLIVPAAEHIPKEVTAGLSTVAIRYPDHPIALALIRAAGVPVAAPSANRSGRPSPTLAEHVLEDLGDQVQVILDGGPCRVGLESTILDVSVEPPAILRPGEITAEALSRLLGPVRAEQPHGVKPLPGQFSDGTETAAKPADEKGPKAPGMKYRHYAPKAPVTLLAGTPEKTADYLKSALAAETAYELAEGREKPAGRIGLLLTEETWDILNKDRANWHEDFYCRSMGSFHHPKDMGRLLYDELRRCDQEGIRHIYIEACSRQGSGAAVMNRLVKASGNHVVDVDS